MASYTTNASNELTATSNAAYTYDSNGGWHSFRRGLNFRMAHLSRRVTGWFFEFSL